MHIVLQRVSKASVTINTVQTADIQAGILALVGFTPSDTQATIERAIKKCLQFRIFSDENGKMNLSLEDTQGELLIVPQFTLAADTTRGLRPSFSHAANPENGLALFEYLCEHTATKWGKSAFGTFGADMEVSLVNEGPVTFMLEV